MATKDMERKALEEIRNIVEDLGKDSYIGMAMDGVFEDAEQNIENDWAMSWKNRAETATKKLHDTEAQINDVIVNAGKYKNELALAKQHMELEAQRANDAYAKLHNTTEQLRDVTDAMDQLKADNEAMANEIIKLKAKLYDLMVK